MLSPIILRAATSSAPHIARIYAESWNMGFRELMPVRELTAELVARWESALAAPVPLRWWVADVGSVLVGVAGIGSSRDPVDPNLGELDTIAVYPAWWRSGIGRALMATAIHALRANAYREAVACIMRKANASTKQLAGNLMAACVTIVAKFKTANVWTLKARKHGVRGPALKA